MFLANSKQPFYLLQVFPLSFIVQHVCLLARKDSRSATALVDADHRDSHRPWTVADTQFHVLVVSFHVFSEETVLNDQKE